MRERRFLVRDLASGPEVSIRGDEAHHLLHVLRLHPGDEVVLFDGLGGQARAVLTHCQQHRVTARQLETLPSPELPLQLEVAVAIPKGDRMSLIIQNLTELGVSRVIPLRCERTALSAASGGTKRLARWQRIALGACKQSGRAKLMRIDDLTGFMELLDRELPPGRLLACPGGGRLPGRPPAPPRSCLVAVGPEGGFTEQEASAALRKGFRTLGLGTRTLRTETAAIAAAAILQWAWGDLNQ